MRSSVMGTSKKVDWEKVRGFVFTFAVIGVIVYYAIIAANEGNKMFWLGVLAAVAGAAALATSESRQSKLGSNTQMMMGSLFFVFALVSPFLHDGVIGVFVNEKVWMVDGKTTINHDVLWRSPFSKFATSINEKQDVSFIVSGKTKDGTAVVATLSGEFSISDDEKVVIKHFGKMQNPDTETADMLKKTLQKSFEKAIATMTVADIAMTKNNFAIEHTVADMTAVDDLGLVGNGPIVVSGLHPYFVGK